MPGLQSRRRKCKAGPAGGKYEIDNFGLLPEYTFTAGGAF